MQEPQLDMMRKLNLISGPGLILGLGAFIYKSIIEQNIVQLLPLRSFAHPLQPI